MYYLTKNVQYIIADPSLLLTEKEYLLFKFELAGRSQMTVNGKNIIVFKSLSGAGDYYTNSASGEMISVKDKYIAAMPVDMCSKDMLSEFEIEHSCFYLNVEKNPKCIDVNGLLSFSNIQINTDSKNKLGSDYWSDDDEEPVYMVKINEYPYFEIPDEDDIPF